MSLTHLAMLTRTSLPFLFLPYVMLPSMSPSLETLSNRVRDLSVRPASGLLSLSAESATRPIPHSFRRQV